MISFEYVKVEGWQAAIRGMRNPMNSWDKSDSAFYNENGFRDIFGKDADMTNYVMEDDIDDYFLGSELIVGPNDLDLMKRLAANGPVHAKYRRMINVTMDITAPLYWWKEFDTYKVGTVANSCSTMHKIHSKEFELEDFSTDHLIGFNFDGKDFEEANKGIPQITAGFDDKFSPLGLLKLTIRMLNVCRELYLKTKDKKYWWQMIQLLPSSYNQRRTVQMNYEVLAGIYKHRKDHKLDGWVDLCNLIKALPLSEIITGEEKEKEEK